MRGQSQHPISGPPSWIYGNNIIYCSFKVTWYKCCALIGYRPNESTSRTHVTYAGPTTAPHFRSSILFNHTPKSSLLIGREPVTLFFSCNLMGYAPNESASPLIPINSTFLYLCNRSDLSKPLSHFQTPQMKRRIDGTWASQPGCKGQPLFNVPLENVITDELHLLLCITDRLEHGIILEVIG